MAQGKVRWLGHAFCEFTTGTGKTILIDAWTKDAGNPGCPFETGEIETADLILASHDHFDHVGSMIPLADQTGAQIGGQVQTMRRFIGEGFPEDRVFNYGMGVNPGGSADLGFASVTATPAFHSSDTGCCLGFVIKAEDGTTIYHPGDTGIFGDMELIGRLYPLDLAFLPIGGVFTMDAYQAAESAAMLKANKVIPIHYASFPVIAPNADEFVSLCAERAPETEVVVLDPGQEYDLG